MTQTIDFISEQIKSDEVWKSDHKRAMECAEFGDKIKVGLSYFGLIRGADDLWSRQVQSGTIAFDTEVAKSLHTAYEWWIKPCVGVFKVINQFEKEGFAVEGAAQLRDAYNVVRSILRTDVDEVVANFQKARKVA